MQSLMNRGMEVKRWHGRWNRREEAASMDLAACVRFLPPLSGVL